MSSAYESESLYGASTDCGGAPDSGVAGSAVSSVSISGSTPMLRLRLRLYASQPSVANMEVRIPTPSFPVSRKNFTNPTHESLFAVHPRMSMGSSNHHALFDSARPHPHHVNPPGF